jgi:hypothetical protein
MQERYPVLRLAGTAKFRSDHGVPDGSTNHRAAGWLVTFQSSKSLSQSPNEVQVSHQRPQKRASSCPSSLQMVIVVDTNMLVKVPIRALRYPELLGRQDPTSHSQQRQCGHQSSSRPREGTSRPIA